MGNFILQFAPLNQVDLCAPIHFLQDQRHGNHRHFDTKVQASVCIHIALKTGGRIIEPGGIYGYT